MRGSGAVRRADLVLVRIKGRVEALGGCVAVQTDPFAGTSLEIESPVTERVGAAP